MGELSDHVVYLLSRAAAEQGGVISGDNPAKYNPSNPIRLWIIQLVLIVGLTQLLALFLSRIRQPRVIAEVIGGVILGPSVMGHIPGFTSNIFPTDSIVVLAATANIGLILFLFLVALEIDTRLLKRNIVASATVSIAGLAIPLALGAALGVGIYREFISESVNFGYFLLFVAVAIGITAFPVLCRILTELKLLDTEVGLVTLSAGIGNDVVGWILLALAVALVNASTGLAALYVLLVCAGYTVILLYPGRWAFHWLCRRTGSLEQGSPTPFMMTITLLVVFISAFFTDIIGVHAIFGGFLAGLLIPHENGFAISFVEKLEDLVTIIFLPIYFTLSGLRTNLGLLDTGVVWGYIVLICLVAFTSKFVACGVAAHFNGYNWRESGAIGSLMSCKGLVELIVLNIGLQANILTPQAFSMFVVHALILTFMTTPLVLLFYPAKYRIHHRGDRALGADEHGKAARPASDDESKTKFAIVLDKIEAIPAVMSLSHLLHSRPSVVPTTNKELEAFSATPPSTPITIEALRLMELTNRTSAVLRSQEAEMLIHNDPVVSIYRTFGQLNNFNVSANLSVVNASEFPQAIADHVASTKSHMLIVPWARGAASALEDEIAEQQVGARNPFDGIFQKTAVQDQTGSVVYSEFIRNVFAKAPTDIALFVDRGLTTSTGITAQHIFLPFIGGPDDRLALTFLVELCERSLVTATVVRIFTTEVGSFDLDKKIDDVPLPPPIHTTMAAADTNYGQQTTQTRITSNTADNILWERYAQHANSRITFKTESTPTPLHRITDLVKTEVATTSSQLDKTLVVFIGRSRRLAVESLSGELQSLLGGLGLAYSTSVSKTLGDVGAALVATNVKASLLVLQAALSSSN
ncbi:cation/H+ exchanger [Pholiota conissans]|uniref:Cation/H+ exchanger n=1 Tax=Pholiota conissans TaxID=109636 RepID=A0A9P5Z574_9AGAR|nr:cation/H+ exchanger [Pholiota conissans]